MKKAFLFLICKNRNKKEVVTGIKIRKDDKLIKFDKEQCREIYLYLRSNYKMWSAS